MNRLAVISSLLLVVIAVAGNWESWEPDDTLLARVEPLIKEHCWKRSDQRRRLAEGEIRIEVDAAGTNIVVRTPDVSVRETFTIRRLPYARYYRKASGKTEGDLRYLRVQFSPTPITNHVSLAPIIFCGLRDTNPVPFSVYVDVDRMKVLPEHDWWGYRSTRHAE